MQTVRPAPSRHHATRKFVDDDHFAVFHDILDVAAVECVRFDRSLDVMLDRPILRISDIRNAEKPLNFLPALIGYRDRFVLFIDREIAGVLLRLSRSDINLFAFFQLWNDPVDPRVLVRRLFAGPRNNEWCTCFVDQDGIDFVDNCVSYDRAARNP